MAARKQTPAKTGPESDEAEPEPADLPEWDKLPPWFRDILLLFRRSAYMIDEAHKRCPRRDCRSRDLCFVGHDDPDGCRGKPSERAEHWVEGMWMARSFDLSYEIFTPARGDAGA